MKIIFADVDGVLIHLDCYHDPRLKSHNQPAYADPACVMWLGELCRQADARIVVSSCHRGPRQLGTLRRKFTAWGLRDSRRRIIDMTGRKLSREEGGRGAEIAAWLRAHPEVTRYVVIDDDPIERAEGLSRRRIVCVREGYFRGGFRSYHAAQAARILGVKNFNLRPAQMLTPPTLP